MSDEITEIFIDMISILTCEVNSQSNCKILLRNLKESLANCLFHCSDKFLKNHNTKKSNTTLRKSFNIISFSVDHH